MEVDVFNKDKGYIIVFYFDEGVKIYGIEMELCSVCFNFIFNVINYMLLGGYIDVYWLVIKDGVKFVVKDDGDGIE